MNDRKKILEEAIHTVCVDRDRQYGDAEDNFALIGRLWSEYLDIDVRAKDVAAMMILLKVARIKTGAFKFDNYVDIAGYAACGGAIDINDSLACVSDVFEDIFNADLEEVSEKVSKVSRSVSEEGLKVSSEDDEPSEDELDEAVEIIDDFMENFEVKPVELEDKPKRKRGGQKKPIDDGKIEALRRAGWSLAKIADEMGCSPQTVANRLAKMEAENENSEKEEAEDVGV